MTNKLLGPISAGRSRITTTVRPRWKGNQFTGVHCKLDNPILWKLVYVRWRNPRDENHAPAGEGVPLTLGINYGTPQYAIVQPNEVANSITALATGFSVVNYNNENFSFNAALWCQGNTLTTNAPGLAGTSFTVTATTGAQFSTNSVVYIAATPESTTFEIGVVTGVAGDTLTITRAQQGTVALNVQTNWWVYGAGWANLNKLITDQGVKAKNLCMVPAASRWDQSFSNDQTKTTTIAKTAGSFTYQAQSKQGPGNPIGQSAATEVSQIHTMNPAMNVGVQVSSQPQNWPNATSTDNHIAASDTFQQLCEISRQGANGRPDFLQFFRPTVPDAGWPETLRAFAMFRPYWRGDRWI